MEKLIENLWNKYTSVTPMATEIKSLVDSKEGKKVFNDHIALRTLSCDSIGIDALAKAFIDKGYKKYDAYNFKAKKLNANHFLHENPKYPKIFISELRFNELSSTCQEVAQMIIKSMANIQGEDLLLSGRQWKIEYATYQRIYEESEYLAWFYVYGFLVNHFTMLVNDTSFESMEAFNDWLENNGYILNNSGGKIKGKGNNMLEQSSTMAQKILIEFTDGNYEIPSCFYEFAKRYPDKNGNLYKGFIEASADKIFESTNFMKEAI